MNPDILSCLTEQDWTALLNNALRVTYAKGDTILEEGSQRRAIFLLDRGYATISSSHQGQGIHLNQIGPGELFGEISFLEGRGASASVIAEEEAEVRIIDEAALQSLLSAVPGLATRFYQSLALVLSQRLRKLSSRFATVQGDQTAPAPHVGHISRNQVPNALMATLDRFRIDLTAIEQQLSTQGLAPAAGQTLVTQTCNDLLRAFADQVASDALMDRGWDDLLAFNDAAQLEAGIGDYVFRDAFPWLMRSATMACCYARGQDDINDRRVGELIEAQDPAGDGWIGPLIDAWFLDRPFGRTYRWQRQQVEHTLAALVPEGPSPLRVTSLAGGTAQELLALLRHQGPAVYGTCLDAALPNLSALAQRVERLNLGNRINLLKGDITALVEGQDNLALPPQQGIYGLDVAPRWDDERVVALLDWCYERLAGGGVVLLGSLSPDFPDALLLKHLLNWTLHYRTEADWQRLVAQSRFGPAMVSPHGMNYVSHGAGWAALVGVQKAAD